MRDTVKGIPEDDDGYEWSLRFAKRSCLALVGLLAFFWVAAAVAAVRAATPAGRTCLTEASGGVTFERLASLGATGVDRVSASALTFAPPLDVGLDEG